LINDVHINTSLLKNLRYELSNIDDRDEKMTS